MPNLHFVPGLHFVLTGLVLLFLFEIKVNEVSRDSFFRIVIFITQYLFIKKQETQVESNHLKNSVTKNLSTVTFLTFFVNA